MTNSQTGGNGSTNLQAGGNIIHNNFIISSVEDIAKKLLNSTFAELSDETKLKINDNKSSYEQELILALHGLKTSVDEVKERFDDPDFQYISKKACISAMRSSSKDLHSQLASLIIGRIEH